jgi:hypothetical protein
VYVIRAEIPLLWVEYEEGDVTLSEGDVFALSSDLGLFRVDDIIPLVSGGVILALHAGNKANWPAEKGHVKYLRVHRGG